MHVFFLSTLLKELLKQELLPINGMLSFTDQYKLFLMHITVIP